jgi:hypothetical protein
MTAMNPVKARVKNGRLVLDVPTDLPEGEEVELVRLERADELEPLTEQQAAAVRKWQEDGKGDSAQVTALRKKARGEPLTDAERVLLDRSGRRPEGVTVPHEVVVGELAHRQRRGA